MTSKMLKETALDIYEEYTRQAISGDEFIAERLLEELVFFLDVEQSNMNPLDLKALRTLVVKSQKQD